MINSLPPEIISDLKIYFKNTFGLSFRGKSEADFVRIIDCAARHFDFSSSHEFAQWLLFCRLNEEQCGRLASCVTIGETYFFREKKSFDFLEYIYLPALIYRRQNEHRYLRIWSAGCATGEEPYSIAILLSRLIPDIKSWDIKIIGTDINLVFLEKAKKGIYTKWSFRGNPDFIQKKYFREIEKNSFEISKEIKNMVQFSRLNLAQNIYPSELNYTSNVDIIFCRNVLIYLSPEMNTLVSQKLYNSLDCGGVLLVSPVEMSNLISEKFERIYYSGFTIYRKSSAEKYPSFAQKKELERFEERISAEEKKINHDSEEENKKEDEKSENKSEEKVRVSLLEQFELLIKNEDSKEIDFLLNEILTGDFEEESKRAIQFLIKFKANNGNFDEAILLCDRAIQLNKTEEDFYFLKAIVLQEKGEFEAALAVLQKVIYLNPDFVPSYFLAGNIYMKTERYKQGMKSYSNVLTILENTPDDFVIPGSEGMTSGGIKEIIQSIKV